MDRNVAPVASGTVYRVVAVNGRPPIELDEFAAREVVTAELARGDRRVVVRGSVRGLGGDVLVYEKDADGVGKDVRVWTVTHHQNSFEAMARPTM